MASDKKGGMALWLEGIAPASNYDLRTVPRAPDYQDTSFWAATPRALGAARMTPLGETRIDPEFAEADVFYVHPTTYVGSSNWNEDISVPMAETRSGEMVAELIMPGHASLFNDCCRIYAPRYRQANLTAFFTPNDSGRSALDLAYTDVVAAFRHYMAVENNGRPFFLAGHSQGTAHLMRLLAEDFDPNWKHQLIATYLLGFKVTAEKAASFAHVATPAAGANDRGVFVAYDCFLEGVDALNQADGAEHRFAGGWRPRGRQSVIGLNPVNWSGKTLSDVSEHSGFGVVQLEDPSMLPKLFFGGDNTPFGLKAKALKAPIKPGVAASVDAHGFLKISLPEQAYMNDGIFGGNYHNRDIALFYMDLRKNIQGRLVAFLAAR